MPHPGRRGVGEEVCNRAGWLHRDGIDTLKRQTRKQLKGMLGPATSGTERTPGLMAEAGLIYHAD